MNRLKDLTMPTLCLAIGIWAAFTYPTQLHTFYEDKIKPRIPHSAPAAAASLITPSVTPTIPNNTTEDNRKQVAKAAADGKSLGLKATIVRGIAMPADCANVQLNLVTYVEQHGDKAKPGYVADADIPGYVCGWN
jgi:hypothetical protein